MKIDQSVIGYLRRYFLPRTGDTTVGGTVVPDTSETYDLGKPGKRFNVIYARSVIADNIGVAVGGGSGGDADTVDGFHAAASPSAGVLLALNGSAVFPTTVYPSALLLDGTRQLTGNLSVAAGITIDGVDISAHAADGSIHHLSGMSADDHTQYAHSESGGTRVAYGANRLYKTITAGNGLTGGGQLDANRTLSVLLQTPSGLVVSGSGLALDDAIAGAGLTVSSKVLAVGQGNGITVSADAVTLTTPTTSLTHSTTNAVSASGHTHAIVTAYDVTSGVTGILRANTGNLYLAGLGVGINALSAVAHIYGLGPQLRIDRGGGMYSDFSVDPAGTLQVQAVGNVYLVPAGSVIFNPTGNDVRPENNYDLNLGLINKKWLTLHAAELWVETLVAQNTMATIGGRILVGPTSKLEADFSTGVYTFLLEHNSFVSGDIVYMEADGKVEFTTIGSLAITAVNTVQKKFTVSGDYTAYFVNGVHFTILGSTGNNGQWTVSSSSFVAGYTEIYVVETVSSAVVDGHILYIGTQGTGPYRFFNLTRNMDGTGENEWYAGDAVFNTGQAGNGFIDLYSLRGVSAASTFGPAIVGNVRTGATYNQWKEHWAVGNLKGVYGYGADTYGLAAGRYEDGYVYVTVDSTNGFMIRRGVSTPLQLGRWDVSGNITIGDFGDDHLYITPTALQIKSGTSVYTDLRAGVLTLGLYGGNERIVVSAATGIEVYGGGTRNFYVDTSGNTLIGRTGTGQSNVYITSGSVQLRNNTTAVITLLSSANAQGQIATFGGVIGIATTGGIFQGSGTFASPTTGMKIYNTGTTGRVQFYNSSSLVLQMDNNGIEIPNKLWANSNGVVVHSTSGLYIGPNATIANSYLWIRSSANSAVFGVGDYDEVSSNRLQIYAINAYTYPGLYINRVGGSVEFMLMETAGITNEYIPIVASKLTLTNGPSNGLVLGVTPIYQNSDNQVYITGNFRIATNYSLYTERLTIDQLGAHPATPGSGYVYAYGFNDAMWFKADTGISVPMFMNKYSFGPRDATLWGASVLYTNSEREFVQLSKPASSGYEYVDYHFSLGQGWAGKTLTVEIYYTVASGSGNFNIQAELFRMRHTTGYSTSYTSASGFTAILAPGVMTIRRASYTITLDTATWSDSDAAKLRITRYNDANDTHLYSMMIAVVGVYVN